MRAPAIQKKEDLRKSLSGLLVEGIERALEGLELGMEISPARLRAIKRGEGAAQAAERAGIFQTKPA